MLRAASVCSSARRTAPPLALPTLASVQGQARRFLQPLWGQLFHHRNQKRQCLSWDAAGRILKQLGVELHPQKTRIVHVRYGFEFLGYKIKRGYRKLHLPESKIRSQARQDALYAYPKAKSISRFMDQVRQRTKRTMPLPTKELTEGLNPLLRGWGEYYKRAHIRKLFQRLDGWVRRRIWSHRYKCWRNAGWKRPPTAQLYGEYELVRLIDLIPSLASRHS